MFKMFKMLFNDNLSCGCKVDPKLRENKKDENE